LSTDAGKKLEKPWWRNRQATTISGTFSYPENAAIAILSEYLSVFAHYLLPENFAVGVGGGCDVVIKTMQLGVNLRSSVHQLDRRNTAKTSWIKQ
jgi:hypothetical protein